MSKQRTFLLCFAPLPGGCLAFDASLIGEFSLAPSAEPSAADAGNGTPLNRLDLVELFRLPPHGSDAFRRALVVDLEGEGRQQPLVIVVGEELRIEAVALTDFLKLPPMLEGIQAATGVSGLVRRGDDLALFVDVRALVEIARGRPPRGRS